MLKQQSCVALWKVVYFQSLQISYLALRFASP